MSGGKENRAVLVKEGGLVKRQTDESEFYILEKELMCL